MMKWIVSICIGLLGMVSVGYADPIASYFDLTEVGTSAESIRKGNIQGFSNMASGIFENPASIYRVYKLSTTGFMTTFMGESKYQNLAVSMRLPVGVVGFGMMRLGVDDIYKTRVNSITQEFEPYSTFNYDNRLYKMVYQVSQSRLLHLGAALNYYTTKMDTVKGEGVNVDLGAVIDGDIIDVSLVLKNLITSSKVKYKDSDTTLNSSNGRVESLPLSAVVGIRYRLNHMNIYGQFKTIGESRNFVKNVGVDYKVPFMPLLEVSGGYREYYKSAVNIEGETSEKVLKSATIGLGLDLFGVNFDYAFEKTLDSHSYASYRQKHYFSVGLSF